MSFPEVIAEQRRGTAAFEGFFVSKVTTEHRLYAQCRKEVACNFNGVKLPGIANAGEFVLQRVVEGLECGHILEGPVVPLEFTKDIDRVGVSGESTGCTHFRIEAFAGSEPDELMRLREWQWAQQHGVHNAEHGGVEAGAKCENQDRNRGKSRIVAQRAEGVPCILQRLGIVLVDTSTAFHVLSYALTGPFDGEDVAELALGFGAGHFGRPAASDQVFCLAFNMEAQLGLDVGPGVGTENAIMPAPHGDLLHVVSCPGRWVAPRTLATASV